MTGSEFSATKCLQETNRYIKKILKLTDDDWEAIYEAVSQVHAARGREAKAETGAAQEEEDDDDEPLLPTDPPSPTLT
jgi:hypothetical protein